MIAAMGFNVLFTALLSAALTWAVAYWYFKRRVQSQLETALEKLQAEFEQRVKAGVLAAGEELMPKLREQVKLGFQDALRDSRTGEMVEGAVSAVNKGAEIIASGIEAGTDLLTNSIGSLFGLKDKK